MSGKCRTELIDVFKAEAANVKALAMQALDADISLLQVAPVIILRTQYYYTVKICIRPVTQKKGHPLLTGAL